jgi:hypothetical protein
VYVFLSAFWTLLVVVGLFCGNGIGERTVFLTGRVGCLIGRSFNNWGGWVTGFYQISPLQRSGMRLGRFFLAKLYINIYPVSIPSLVVSPFLGSSLVGCKNRMGGFAKQKGIAF